MNRIIQKFAPNFRVSIMPLETTPKLAHYNLQITKPHKNMAVVRIYDTSAT